MTAKTAVGTWGNALGIRIPKALCDKLHIHVGTELTITEKRGSLLLKPSHELPTSLSEVFEGYTGSHISQEWDTGEAVGKEMW